MHEKVCHKVYMVGICTMLHFLVDALCLCCLYLMASCHSESSLLGVFLTYNVLAFMTQPVTGWWADCSRRPHWLLLSSVLLLMAAVLFSVFVMAKLVVPSTFSMMVVAVLLGMGNSIFHTWGGRQTVLKAGNDPRALGVFVSTGAFGLAVGAFWCSWQLLLVIMILVSLLALVYVRHDTASNMAHADTSLKSRLRHGHVIVAILVLMAFVMFRSSMGEAFTSGMNKGGGVILLIGATAMLGKMSGGWLARHFGAMRSFVILLVSSLACYALGGTGIGIVLLGLFLINCTMPITLYWANTVLPGREGLAFGLLAAALIPGFLVAYL